ncbi:MAG: hypothetical protein UX91_C0007G0123 [Candidatus Amesbacteria bacterium GW2011_GWB1_47_19]|nr:MAG: hypothetical protein UW51_C0006G0059 [Candidatus Amesbacteria bacterium GW2011_GWA1_44_24]KKU31905.1 MAG: hypothetical protein UX46_C0002G0123 [Candidatus Amesbacteria bacterium GW2011_GWC1_46_24]KKU66841.1 MAG: hypothetical protein UX91_C0007G0123 [Candidatus Amesbacteria bacterium GW2011_GWB1_47_19]
MESWAWVVSTISAIQEPMRGNPPADLRSITRVVETATKPRVTPNAQPIPRKNPSLIKCATWGEGTESIV